VTTVVPSVPNALSNPNLPPEIAKIAAAWDRLPEAVRAGINAMIAAASGDEPASKKNET
jgi:hypothetical protein